MNTIEIQEYINVYCMVSFHDGRKEPGIIINKYNVQQMEVEYYFVPQVNLQAYKNAFENYDKDAYSKLSEPIQLSTIVSVRTVSLSDYKIIMELLHERNQYMQTHS